MSVEFVFAARGRAACFRIVIWGLAGLITVLGLGDNPVPFGTKTQLH